MVNPSVWVCVRSPLAHIAARDIQLWKMVRKSQYDGALQTFAVEKLNRLLLYFIIHSGCFFQTLPHQGSDCRNTGVCPDQGPARLVFIYYRYSLQTGIKCVVEVILVPTHTVKLLTFVLSIIWALLFFFLVLFTNIVALSFSLFFFNLTRLKWIKLN